MGWLPAATSMLRLRVITALAMAGLFLAGIFVLPLPALAAAFALVVAAGAWEWAPLAGLRGAPLQAAFALLVLAGCAAGWFLLPLGLHARRADVQPVLGVACLWWCFALLWVRAFPGSAMIWNARPLRALMGLMILVPASGGVSRCSGCAPSRAAP